MGFINSIRLTDLICQLSAYFISIGYMGTSIILVLFSIERMIKIRYPMKVTRLGRIRFTTILCSFSTGLIILFNIPLLFRAGVDDRINVCWSAKYVVNVSQVNIFILCYIAIFILSGASLSIMSCLIACKLSSRKKEPITSNSALKQDLKNARHTARILLIITISYFLFSFSPQMILTILAILQRLGRFDSATMLRLRYLLTRVAAIVLCFHHSNNFWLYIASSKIYQRRFIELFYALKQKVYQ